MNNNMKNNEFHLQLWAVYKGWKHYLTTGVIRMREGKTASSLHSAVLFVPAFQRIGFVSSYCQQSSNRHKLGDWHNDIYIDIYSQSFKFRKFIDIFRSKHVGLLNNFISSRQYQQTLLY